MRYYRLKNLLILLLISLLMLQCSVFKSEEPDVESYLSQGWDYFEDGYYLDALDQFEEAISVDKNKQECYHGRAWCYLMLSEASEAIVDFEKALELGNISLDPHAGLAAAYLAQENYSSAIEKANYVLTGNSNYYFEHNPLIDYHDMHLILAMAYFHEGDLLNAQEHVDFLFPENQLDSNQPSTWTLQQVSYDSYAEALMAVIDYLDDFYGMV
jgi:tetratricopeptide (TPR) repeat protein